MVNPSLPGWEKEVRKEGKKEGRKGGSPTLVDWAVPASSQALGTTLGGPPSESAG